MAAFTANSSSTYLELAWASSHISLGTGYDFLGRQLRPSALNDVGVPPQSKEGRDIERNVHSVSTANELKTRIKADFKANVPIEGVSLNTENSYLRSVETSDTSLTQIIQETIVDQPAKLDIHHLRLTEGAKALLDGPEGWKKFSQKYGEYFVYGYRSRARFSAICDIKTSSKKSRDEIKTSLEAEVEGAGSLTATLKSMSESKSDTVSIDVNIHTSGLNNVENDARDGAKLGGESKTTKTNKVEEVQKKLEEFQKHFKTQPYLGLLCHYSVLDTSGNIPLPQNQFARLGPELERMYKSLFTAQIDLATSPMVQAAAAARGMVDLCDQITKLNLTDESAINQMDEKVKASLNSVDLWRLRNDLLVDAGKLKNDRMHWGDWIEAFHQREWASGVLSIDTDAKYHVLSGDVSHKNERYQTEYSFAQYNTQEFAMGDHDKIIIGYKITSCWNDGTNGWYKMHHGNVLESQIKVEFSSYKTRGCNWEIDVWMVPKNMYEKKST